MNTKIRSTEFWKNLTLEKIRGDNRKLNFRRFPYAIIYNVNATTLYIVAVMHLYRRPFYWSQRQRSK